LLEALSEEEQRTLFVLLQRVAEQQGLIKECIPDLAISGRPEKQSKP